MPPTHPPESPLYCGHILSALTDAERCLLDNVAAVRDPNSRLGPYERAKLVDEALTEYRQQTITVATDQASHAIMPGEPDPWASIDVWQAWAASLVAWERAIYDHHGQLTTAQLAFTTRRARQDAKAAPPMTGPDLWPDDISRALSRQQDPDWLTKAVAVATALWPDCPDNADSNVRDAYWLARCVQEQVGVVLPTTVPSVSRGVALVECVEKRYINLTEADKVIRAFDANTIAGRCKALIDATGRHGLLSFPDDDRATDAAGFARSAGTRLAVALHTWYGCVSLGKSLRATARCPDDVPGQPPTFVPIPQNQRWKGHAFISTLAEEEAKRGNPWIRFGMTCTRLFERHRHNLTVDWWLPGDSPYWEG